MLKTTESLLTTPVDAGLVYYPEDYVYSSAADYAERKGMLDNVVVFQYFG